MLVVIGSFSFQTKILYTPESLCVCACVCGLSSRESPESPGLCASTPFACRGMVPWNVLAVNADDIHHVREKRASVCGVCLCVFREGRVRSDMSGLESQ